MKTSRSAAFALFLLACGNNPPNVGNPQSLPSDAVACGMGVIAATAGSVDVADLLRCGLAIADAYALVLELISTAQSSDAGAALTPGAQAYLAKLQDLKAKLEAQGAK